MSNHNALKAQRKKELLSQLESKKQDLQKHIGDAANKSVDVGKGLLLIGTGVLIIYSIFDRFLESKFKAPQIKEGESPSKSSTSRLLYPVFSMLLNQGSSFLFDKGQQQLVDYLKNRKLSNERLPKGLPK